MKTVYLTKRHIACVSTGVSAYVCDDARQARYHPGVSEPWQKGGATETERDAVKPAGFSGTLEEDERQFISVWPKVTKNSGGGDNHAATGPLITSESTTKHSHTTKGTKRIPKGFKLKGIKRWSLHRCPMHHHMKPSHRILAAVRLLTAG